MCGKVADPTAQPLPILPAEQRVPKTASSGDASRERKPQGLAVVESEKPKVEMTEEAFVSESYWFSCCVFPGARLRISVYWRSKTFL